MGINGRWGKVLALATEPGLIALIPASTAAAKLTISADCPSEAVDPCRVQVTVAASIPQGKVGGNRYILIATNPGDPDSFLVQEALRRKGCRAELAHLPDFPSLSTGSLHLGPSADEDHWQLIHQLNEDSEARLPDTLWWRRPERPVIPSDVHPEDREFVLQENAKFILGLWHHLPSGTVYVNSPMHALKADRKPYQLRIAREIGFAIPPTLFSNDPQTIRAAVHKWGGRAIYKSFGSIHNFWLDSERQKLLALFTTAVDESSLPDDEVLSLTPGIYQPLLDKAFELRVTIFGSTVFCTKIFSQEQDRSRIDWRNGQQSLRYETIEIPAGLRDLCVSMLHHLGLLIGCFDLVVTPQEEVVFLEVNEGGQFLWLETASGAPLLDAFSDFLIDPHMDFRWQASPEPLRVKDVQAIATERMAQAAETHLVPEPLISFGSAPQPEPGPYD
jgi:hypothetical protein